MRYVSTRFAIGGLIVALLVGLNVFSGEAQGQVTVTFESLTLAVGESGSVAARIDCPLEGGCAAFDVTVRYDPTIVTVDGVEFGPYLGSLVAPVANSVDGDTGTVRVAAAALGATIDYGEPILFWLEVTGLSPGLTTLTVTGVEIADLAANPVQALGLAGAISVTTAAAPTALPTPTLAPTATSAPARPPRDSLTEALARANNFSGSNADWEPFEADFDGMTMVLVPAGCFVRGSDTENPDESPAHQVCFEEPFWIGRTEVTRAQYGSEDSNLPQNEIMWPDSNAHCESRGFRLPTEAEWEYAARGPDALIYPWGNTYDGDLVVAERDGPEPVGSIPAGASWVGALDMAGNVWEHLADWYDEDYYETLGATAINPQGPESGDTRVVHGGSWNFFATNSQRSSDRGFTSLSSSFGGTGFRCAMSLDG